MPERLNQGSGQYSFSGISGLLDDAGVGYRTVRHAPTRTSEESAEARGESLSIGGKALVIKVDDEFALFVLSAARKFDSVKVKRRFRATRIRFATVEELRALTGLEPGSVPPFGRPFLDIDLYVDESIVKNKRIAFNAGYLLDGLAAIGRPITNMAFTLPTKPAVLTGASSFDAPAADDYLYLLMPVRLVS